MHPRWLLSTALCVLAFAAPVALAGSVYKWTDGKGAIHYDDQNSERGQQLTREYVEKRVVKPVPDWVGRVPVEFARDVAQRCVIAREREASFRGAGQIYVRDSRGKVQALAPDQARRLRTDSSNEVKRLCAPDSTTRLYRERLQALATPTRSASPLGGSRPVESRP